MDEKNGATSSSEPETIIVKVYLANGSFNNVRFNDLTTIQKIISVVVSRFAGGDVDLRHYGLRLVETCPDGRPKESIWLHREMQMKQVLNRHGALLSGDVQPYRLELRVRYLSKNLEEMYHTQKATFYYLYDQVRVDFLHQVAPTIDPQVAIELGCIEIRRLLKDMQSSALEKKSNLEFLENEIGLNRFFPANILSDMKPKALRKQIQQHFKKLAHFTEADCMFRFLQMLSGIARFDIEIFKCFLAGSWSVPISIIVGPDVGISYVTDSICAPTSLADFLHVTDVQTSLVQQDSQKTSVTIHVSAEPEPLVIVCPTLVMAESLADLIDGYHMLCTQSSSSVWSRRDWYPEQLSKNSLPEEAPACVAAAKVVSAGTAPHRLSNDTNEAEDEFDTDYSAPLNKGFELDRSNVTLGELLGEGQFGDVYSGVYEQKDGSVISVAVKACKVESEGSHDIMQQFDHPHIIKLIGICSDSPIWIIMELANHGELRSYLMKRKQELELLTLLVFCYQLSSALSYLASRKFVHRDIAARNVLVFTDECVKLSDFGLSRWVEEQSFYTATRGKLPIKWMAPESINFRRFTVASDVWMFGVCMWEILMLGAKPFQGIRNHDVIHRLEDSVRLAMPPLCPPHLYALLTQMWSYEPSGRPSMSDVREQLYDLVLEEKEVQKEALRRDQRRFNRTRGTESYEEGVPAKSVGFNDNLTAVMSLPLVRGAGRTLAMAEHRMSGGTSQCQDAYHTLPTVLPSKDVKRPLDEVLELQRKQSEEDSKWLQQEEQNFLPKSSSFQDSLALSSSPNPVDVGASPTAEQVCSPSSASVRENERSSAALPPPGMEISRDGDDVYKNVISVVTSITQFSKMVPDAAPAQYVSLVKDIGQGLRKLFDCASAVVATLPMQTHSEVEMAEKVLSSNMQKLVSALRMSVQYATTTLDVEMKRQMLVEAHVLAVECKNFLQAVDSARIRAGIAKFVVSKPSVRSASSESSTACSSTNTATSGQNAVGPVSNGNLPVC